MPRAESDRYGAVALWFDIAERRLWLQADVSAAAIGRERRTECHKLHGRPVASWCDARGGLCADERNGSAVNAACAGAANRLHGLAPNWFEFESLFVTSGADVSLDFTRAYDAFPRAWVGAAATTTVDGRSSRWGGWDRAWPEQCRVRPARGTSSDGSSCFMAAWCGSAGSGGRPRRRGARRCGCGADVVAEQRSWRERPSTLNAFEMDGTGWRTFDHNRSDA
ncbi:MAG: copper resistance protein B [Gemmatimonadaceae bacterium]|nr:copper resistance protein B [Gemmatimonadaceae bacterium]